MKGGMEVKAEDQAGNCPEPDSTGVGVSVAGMAQSSGLDTSAKVAVFSLWVSLPVINMQGRNITSHPSCLSHVPVSLVRKDGTPNKRALPPTPGLNSMLPK